MPRPDPTHIGKAKLRVSLSGPYPKPPSKPPRRRGKGGEAEREPVEPPRPKPLSGGAAAALGFDD